MARWRFAFCSCVLLLVALAGCGGGSTSRVPVEGTVTFDGKPVDGGSISFILEGTTTTAPVGAVIKDGRYAVEAEKGPVPGKYKVEIVWNKTTGKTVPNTSDPGTTTDETKQVIPSRYNSKTELTANITSGPNTVNFDLKAGGPVDSGKSGGGKVAAAGD